MAKPDTDNGWLKYAHELDAALAVADFTKGARIVLREVFAQIFGPAKLKSARLSATEIGAKIGRPKQFVDRGIAELLEARLLERTPGGRFRFLKDYETWVYCPRGASEHLPRFTERELKYIRDAVADAHSHKDASVINPVDPSKDAASSIRLTHKRGSVINSVDRVIHPVDDSSSIRLTRESSPPDPPYGNARAELETLETKDDDDSREQLDPIRSPEHRETVELARALFGDVFAETVVVMGRDIEQSLGGRWDCYRAAMAAVKQSRNTKIDNLHAYCIRTGGQFAATGIPPEPVAYTPKPPKGDQGFAKAPPDFAAHIAGRKKGNP